MRNNLWCGKEKESLMRKGRFFLLGVALTSVGVCDGKTAFLLTTAIFCRW